MTITIILAIWFVCSVVVSPLIGWFLFRLNQDRNALRLSQMKERSRISLGKSIKFLTPHRHRGDPAPPVRRAARGR